MSNAIRGLDVLIKIGDVVVGGQRNGTLEMSAETIDTTTKQTGGWTTAISGIKSWTSSCDGVFFIDDAGVLACQTAFMDGMNVDLEFAGEAFAYNGSAIITSMSIEAGQEDIVSYSMSFDGAGALSVTSTGVGGGA